jgi:hypothetical protein
MSLAVLADHMASKGRGNDSMLIHMTPNEVAGLQALAKAHGGSLTINPDTGLPEAGWVDKLLPTLIGAAITATTGIPAWQIGLGVGAVETARTGDLGRGISAGLGAYGGANLTSSFTGAGEGLIGEQAIASEAGRQAVAQNIMEGQMTEEAARSAVMKDAVANSGTFEKLGSGFEAATGKGGMQALKAAAPMGAPGLGTSASMAFGPAILAELGAKKNMPQTVTRPGMITPYSFDPYSGTYHAATPYRAAEGGLMDMNNGGYNPGQLDFTQQSEPVVRMAEGGVPGYADGGPLDVNNPIYQYFAKPETQALLASGNDKAIAQVLQDKDWKLADVAAATGTQSKLGDYSTRFVNAVAQPDTSASEFLAATQDVGLQNKALEDAFKNSGLSASAQYALTHNLNDAAGLGATNAAGMPFYNAYGYTAGSAPGDQGGLEGLYSNINFAATGLQNKINEGKLSVAEAQRLADAEMTRIGVSAKDVKAATGKDLFGLFTPKTEVKKTGIVECGPGFKLSIDGLTCVPDTTVITQETQCPTGQHYDPVLKMCVLNTSATQNTSTNVNTPTSISTVDRSALPVGVSGAGITTINPNGTITTRPDLSLQMKDVRDAYEKGGGSLGYTSPTFASLKAVEDKYPLKGGSKQSYDYLTGKTDYSPIPYTKTGEIMKPYSESVLGIPIASSKKMYLFDPTTKQYKINPDYAIPTRDSKGKVTTSLTNKDVAEFVGTAPSYDALYTWMTTNNLSPEQVATASGKPFTEINKQFLKAQGLAGDDGKIDTAKLDEETAKDEKANFDYVAYLKANPDVQAELDAGKANFGTKDDPATAAYEHYLRYGKAGGRKYTKKAAGGGLMNMAMARGGMSQQFDLGGYSDGGRLLRGPGDGVSDSIPATIGNKRPARLADGEFVVPARIVSELGNGSTEAGARKLYAMMDRVQKARRGTVGKGRVAKNSRSEKYLPA